MYRHVQSIKLIQFSCTMQVMQREFELWCSYIVGMDFYNQSINLSFANVTSLNRLMRQ